MENFFLSEPVNEKLSVFLNLLLNQNEKIKMEDKWKIILARIENWKCASLLSQWECSLLGVSGWYFNVFAGEFLKPEGRFDPENFWYKIMLVMWRINVPYYEYDYLFKRNQSVEEEMYDCFDYAPKECGVVSAKDIVDMLMEKWLISLEKFDNYKKGNNNPKVVERIEPQYRKFEKQLEKLENEIGECEGVRLGVIDKDEAVWFLIDNGNDRCFIIRLEEYA